MLSQDGSRKCQLWAKGVKQILEKRKKCLDSERVATLTRTLGGFQLRKLQSEEGLEKIHLGAHGWPSQLSLGFLVSAQVVCDLRVMRLSPLRAWNFLPLYPLPHPQCVCTHSLSLKINKVKYFKKEISLIPVANWNFILKFQIQTSLSYLMRLYVMLRRRNQVLDLDN